MARKLYTYKGRDMTLPEWADEFGLDEKTISRRMYDLKWSFERALTTPVRKRAPSRTNEIDLPLRYQDREWSVPALARHVGISPTTLYRRLYAGLPVDKAILTGRQM